MSNPVVISYPLDLTGRSPDNKVVGETHGPCYPGNRVFVLSYGPFYSKSLVIRNKSTGVALTPNVDYKAVHTFIEPTLKTGLLVCSIIQIEAPAYGIELSCDYQVLGGDYSLSTSALENLVDDLNNDDRAVRWGEIIGKPEAYPPTPHLHDIYDVFGWQYIVAAIEAIRQALLLGRNGNNDDLYAYIDLKHAQAIAAVNVVGDSLGNHLADYNNPHRVTKDQIGLGLVGNYPLATPEIARLNLSHNTLMTPYLMKFANEYHTNDFNNPHQVTKDQTGLGNVDNYITATLQMALAGTDNHSFLTPYGAAAMIAQALSATPPTPVNGPTAGVVSQSAQQLEVNDDQFVGNQYAYTVYFANSSTAGTNPITAWDWTIDGVASTGNTTKSLLLNFTKPTGGPGSSTSITKSVTLTVTDSANLTSTITRSFTYTLTLNVNPPGQILDSIRVNGILLDSDAYGIYEHYASTIQAPVGQTRTHNFAVDIDPYWSDWVGVGGGADALRSAHKVTWLIKNDYTHSAHTYVNNYEGFNTSFSIPVESTYWIAARVDVTVTSLITNLSTTAYCIIDARTNPTYVAPTADFELSAGSLTVTKPATHDLTFIDRSVSNVPGVDIDEVVWDYGGLGRKEEGSSNNAPGGWLHWLGDFDQNNTNGFPVGTKTLTISISAKTATSPWVTTSRSYQLVTNPAVPPNPTANFTGTYYLVGTYVAPPGATPVRLTLNGNLSAAGSVSYPIVSYQWNVAFQGGATASFSGKNPPAYNTTIVDQVGQRNVTVILTVTDSYGNSATKTITFTASLP